MTTTCSSLWGQMTVRADLAFWQSVLDDLERQQ